MKVITIGRNSQNDITINDPKVSRHHCQVVQYDDGSYCIVDFGSTNGTFVNGKRVHGEVKLNPSDVVRIGNTTLQWRNYFNNVSSNGSNNLRVSHPNYTPAPIDRRFSTASSSNSSVTAIVLSLLGMIVLAVILIIAIVHKIDRPNKNSDTDLWHYENGVRTNVPSSSTNRKCSSDSYSIEDGIHYNAYSSNTNTTTNDSRQYFQSSGIKTRKPSQEGFSDIDLTGTWIWESGDNFFKLILSRSSEGRIVGEYCALWGTHYMDCDENNVIKENRTRDNILENTVKIKFASAAWEGRGTALILKLSDDKIQWKLRSIDGESHVPNDVILLRK